MNPGSKPRGWFAPWRRRACAALLLLVAGLSVHVVETIYHANFHAVAVGVAYRSGQMSAAQLTRAVQQYGIKSIVNLRGENPGSDWHQAEIATAAKLKVVYYDRGFGSGDQLTLEMMDDLVTVLRQAPKPVLIHCLGGADRSGLVSALYRFAMEGQTPGAACGELSLWYGHVPLLRPKVRAMDDSFRRYVSNQNARADLILKPNELRP
jgi:protein tyrosine/serine phosphatase